MGRLIHGNLESGMGFVHSKLVPEFGWGKKKSNPYLKSPRYGFLITKEGGGYEMEVWELISF